MRNFDDVWHLLHAFDHLGTRTLPDGTQLVGHVPHVGSEAYLHVVFPGLGSEQRISLEKVCGRPIPPWLLELYSEHNGMILFSGSLALYGLRASYGRSGDGAWQPFNLAEPNVDERMVDAPPEAVFFGTYDWDGSLLYTTANSQAVYRCSRDSPKPLNEWANVRLMLTAEVHRIGRLFDAGGRELDDSVPTTPRGG